MAIIKYVLIIIVAPLIVLLGLVLLPFAIFFSLARLPFARKRIKKLNELIASDWLSRKKYIYISYSTAHPLTDFIEKKVIPKYERYIIYDKWSETENEWSANEPDTYSRVTTMVQDIAGEFDGDPYIFVAALTPEKPVLNTKRENTLFYLGENTEVLVINSCPESVSKHNAQNHITELIESSLRKW